MKWSAIKSSGPSLLLFAISRFIGAINKNLVVELSLVGRWFPVVYQIRRFTRKKCCSPLANQKHVNHILYASIPPKKNSTKAEGEVEGEKNILRTAAAPKVR